MSYRNIFNFPNGYSASVVCHSHSYGGEQGLFELGVMHGGELVYDTPVTSDVLGFLTFEKVGEALKAVEALSLR